jgi:hypothetical protein
MPIIHEWFCADHGAFEGSHGICPHFGCASREVIKEFRTPRGLKSHATKRFDAGIARTAEAYGQSNFRSANREGDTSKVIADGPVLWGDAGSKFLGKPLTQAAAPAQFEVTNQQTGKKEKWTDYGGVPTLAKESTQLNKVTPKAVETIVSDKEGSMRTKLKQG